MKIGNNTIDNLLSKTQKNIQSNSIDLQTWEQYFLYYYQASNKMILDLQMDF